MEKFNVYLNNTVHKANLYIGAKSQSFAVRLRDRVLRTDVFVTHLPMRMDFGAVNELILGCSALLATVISLVRMSQNTTELTSDDVATGMEKFISTDNTMFFKSLASASLEKLSEIEENPVGVLSNSTVGASFVRYRLLHELDDYTLAELDDYSLEYLDYVDEIKSMSISTADGDLVTADGMTLIARDEL